MPLRAGRRTAGRAGGVGSQWNLAPAAGRAFPDEKAPGGPDRPSAEHAHGLRGHDRTDDAAERARDACLRTGRQCSGRRRALEQAAKARTAARQYGEDLTGPAEDGAVHERNARGAAGIVHREARLERVGAVEHHVGAAQKLRRRRGAKPHRPDVDVDERTEPREPLRRHFHLEAAHVAGAIENLPRQIRRLHAIVVHEHEAQGKARRPGLFAEQQRRGAAEPTHSQDDGGAGHPVPSRLNSRSPVVTRARPPSPVARRPAMAEAWDTRSPASLASPARAWPQEARETALRSTETGRSASRGSPGSSSSPATSAMPRAPGSARRTAIKAARAPAGANTARAVAASAAISAPRLRSMAAAASSPSSGGRSVPPRADARALASSADSRTSNPAPSSRNVSRASWVAMP